MTSLRLHLRLLVAAGAIATSTSAMHAQAADSLGTTGGLSLGLSGLRSGDGTTVRADVMWVGAEMNDGVGLRLLRQGLAPRAHGYAAMLVIGGPPHDRLGWARIDFGLGYVGQQSDRDLRFLKRHGLGAEFAATIAPRRFGIVKPELNGWAVVGTSAQFLGVSLGVRILDPRGR
ncbi:MAG: hypothetical protein IT355_03735 [Gemmatimonadaceae bacterium]|nr:hypothetical protein [Gemmatimonadaceae bacterium]